MIKENLRDCPHGHQLGKCDTCDLIEAEIRIVELEQAAWSVITYYNQGWTNIKQKVEELHEVLITPKSKKEYNGMGFD